MNSKLHVMVSALILMSCCAVASGQPTRRQSPQAIPENVLLNIIRHEDERRWDDDLKALLANQDPQVRKRAALAAGRIGDERAVPLLTDMLLTDKDTAVRDIVAFGLGEIESPGGVYALVTVLKHPENAAYARAIEALGKITAAMMTAPPPVVPGAGKEAGDERLDQCKAAIVDALRLEADRKPHGDQLTILLGLTAVLRIKPDGAGPLVAKFLDDADSSIVATALNTMARLRLKDANERVRQLLNHTDPIVRANAARVIGAAEQKSAFEAVLDRALRDEDLRVRVSAIRALASLKDTRAIKPLLEQGEKLLVANRHTNGFIPTGKNEILEIVGALGRLLQNSGNSEAVDFLKRFRILDQLQSPETEIAFARISPETYLSTEPFVGTDQKVAAIFPRLETTWRASSSLAQGLAELANLPEDKQKFRSMALMNFALMMEQPGSQPSSITTAIPTYLRAYAAFKKDVNEPARTPKTEPQKDLLSRTLRAYVVYPPNAGTTTAYISWEDYSKFGKKDVVIRATAAELLGGQPPSEENTTALVKALAQASKFDKESNDAVLAILEALEKQKSPAANDAIKTALDSSDHLVRRRAVALLKANGAGDFSDRIGTVQTRNTPADYRRAIARIGRHVTATIVTSRGSFTIDFIPEDAPLTVDNFIQLAKRGYFNGQTIPRVVPNFVVQAGDPRGDQNGGPGYQIRCEINEIPYERAAVGMALSGKDTGGSQWFVTHSPQPHLDGSYTVFGRVIRGMDVVDNIVRGDTIQRVVVNER